MVDPLKINKTIWIVHPVGFGGEMNLGPVGFLVIFLGKTCQEACNQENQGNRPP